MKVKDFDFDLPESLIAKFPTEERTASRLMELDGNSGQISHRVFRDLIDRLHPGDLLVFNNTRVVPARLFGRKESGGQVEVLYERALDSQRFLAHVRASKSPKPGSLIVLENGDTLTMVQRHDSLFELAVPEGRGVHALLEEVGHMPLPPYIDRADESLDEERYQTVYAQKPGAVAAPTAGLHFTDDILARAQAKGVATAFVTLHVGAGTFQPVRVENIQDHHMHAEYLEVDQAVCDAVNATRARGGRVVAVGTTSVRSLETASQSGAIAPYTGESDIFIYPGYRFRSVDLLLTNFHLPESTLIMLVSALAGR